MWRYCRKERNDMQMYVDVTNREIKISASAQAPALGSAMLGAVSAGRSRGEYDTIREIAEEHGKVKQTSIGLIQTMFLSTTSCIKNMYSCMTISVNRTI